MNGILPDFIRGMRLFRYRFSPFGARSNFPLTRRKTLCIVRAHHANIVKVLGENVDKSKSRDNVRNNVAKNVNEEDVVKAGLARGDSISCLLNDLTSFGGIDSAGLLLLKCISKLKHVDAEKRMTLAEDVLRSLRSEKLKITGEHYTELLACLHGKCFPTMDDLLSKMSNDGISPSTELQEAISRCLFRMQRPEEVPKLINKLNEAGVEVCKLLKSEKLCSYAALGDIDKAWKECDKLLKEDNFSKEELQISILRGLILNGDEIQFKDELENLVVGGHKFSEEEIYSLFEPILISNNFNFVSHVVQLLHTDILVKSLKNVIIKLKDEINVDKVFELIYNIYSVEKPVSLPNFEFPTSMYKAFFDELAERNHPVQDILEKCKRIRKLETCQYALEYMLFKYLTKKEMANSVQVLFALSESGAFIEQSYFWPLLIQAQETFNIEGVCHVTQIMFALGKYPESETLLKYVLPFMEPNLCFKYFKVLSMSGRYFQFLTEVFLIYSLEKGCLKDCVKLLNKRPLSSDVCYYFLEEPFFKALKKGKICPELVKIMNLTRAVDPFTALRYLWTEGEEDRVRELLRLMIAEKVRGANISVGENLISRPNVPDDIKESIKHLISIMPTESRPGTEMEKESLYECLEIIQKSEIHIEELKSKQMNIAGELYRLIKYNMKVGLYSQAVIARDMLLELAGSEPEFSPTYLACLCRLYEYEKNYEEALRYYRIVRRKFPNFLFDVPKVTGLTILFIRMGALDELVDLLNRMPKWWGSLRQIEHKMIGILKGVASLGDPKLTKNIFDILLGKNVISVTEAALAPFIETYLAMEKRDEALTEFKRLISEYKVIPSSVSLIGNLITAREFEKMEEVVEVLLKNTECREQTVIPILRVIACFGDTGILDKYFKLYNIHDTDNRFSYILRWENFGGDLDVRMKAFRTFILRVNGFKSKNYYANFAVQHICCERDGNEARNLRDFLKKQRILSNFEKKLDNVIKLADVFDEVYKSKSSAVRKATMWREAIE